MNRQQHGATSTNAPFAEVVESSREQFTAQCWTYKAMPPYGSLVEVREKEETTLGLVTGIETGSLDPLRTPVTYQKTEEELQQQQPQIFAFLKTS